MCPLVSHQNQKSLSRFTTPWEVPGNGGFGHPCAPALLFPGPSGWRSSRGSRGCCLGGARNGAPTVPPSSGGCRWRSPVCPHPCHARQGEVWKCCGDAANPWYLGAGHPPAPLGSSACPQPYLGGRIDGAGGPGHAHTAGGLCLAAAWPHSPQRERRWGCSGVGTFWMAEPSPRGTAG